MRGYSVEERIFFIWKKLECICKLRAGSQLRGNKLLECGPWGVGWLDLEVGGLLLPLRRVELGR